MAVHGPRHGAGGVGLAAAVLLTWLPLVPVAARAGQDVPGLASFRDLQPGDWAAQALVGQIERHSCVHGYVEGRLRGARGLSRFEAAGLLLQCLESLGSGGEELRGLLAEFEPELAVLRGRVEGLEGRLGDLEVLRFSPTTRLVGQATFVLGGNSFSGNNPPLMQAFPAQEGALTLNYDLRLGFETSFTGKDLLRTQLRAGNFAQSSFGNTDSLNQLEVAFETTCRGGDPVRAQDCGDVLSIYRLYYQFPLGEEFTVTLGGRVRQDDMLAIWPNLYPSDSILDVASYAGAPGAYNTNLGPGAGLWWKRGAWAISAETSAYNGDVGSPTAGGFGTANAGSTGTLQIGVAPGPWALAFTYNVSRGFPGGVYPGSATPLAALNTEADPALAAFGVSGRTDSVALSGYWQPAAAGWLPSISAGWGRNVVQPGEGSSGFAPMVSQSWLVGLQWSDVLTKGNMLGLAVLQPTFVTDCGRICSSLLGQAGDVPHDGNLAWEAWYRLQLTDAITVTPAVFYLANPWGQINRSLGMQAGISRPTFTNFGALVKTTFRF
ncbi:MAG: iron uptake porin [Cyanobacteriota bacterium]